MSEYQYYEFLALDQPLTAEQRAAIGWRRHLETEIADIGAAQTIDDHVVDRAGRDCRQVGIERKPALGVCHQALAMHRQDDQPSVRQDAGAAGRVVLECRVLLALT